MTHERDTMEIDVLFIGAGVANLSAAYRLKKNLDAYNTKAKTEGKKPSEPTIMVIDKGHEIGAHTLSGAVIDPIAFKELFPENDVKEFPFICPVSSENVYYLLPWMNLPIPGLFLPAEMHNSGCYIASISEVSRWLARKCEEAGIEIFTEFAANELIREGKKVIGAKIADKGLDKEGKPGGRFTPGMDISAKVTVLGEGTRGFIAQRLIKGEKLDAESNNQIWGVGVKEIIEIPAGRIKQGAVIHTFGYPLDLTTYGGSFIYAMSDTLVALGLVFALDYHNPMYDTHELFLRFKSQPMVAQLIKGGKVVEYGAKTVPEGGYFALPRLATDGAVLVGDSAGFLNPMRLKGIHLAMKSGILAADKISQALIRNDFSASKLDYRADFDNSWAGKELYHTRNFRQWFHYGGLPVGMAFAGLHMFTGGILPAGRQTTPPDFKVLKKATGRKPLAKTKTDTNLYLDIETDVYKSGAVHREDQPPHCHILDEKICEKCYDEYAAPCTRFCPAKVYEEKKDKNGKFEKIQVSFANCVHCKTCEIKDPFENIEWHPPEGGDGPKYKRM